MRRGVAGPLLAATLALAGCGAARYAGTPADPVVAAPDVALQGARGETLSFARTGGRITLVAFGYTSCADVCPTTLSNWRRVRAALGADSSRVRFVFVSADWRHDTAERAAEFARAFDPAFVGVTSDSATLRRVLPVFRAEAGYGATAPGAPPAFAHSDFEYLVDARGRIVLWYAFGTKPAVIASDLRLWLEQHAR